MTELAIFEQDGTLLVDSRDVARMVDRDHSELLKTIRIYCDYLDEGEIPCVDYFIESTYIGANNQLRPNYLITKKGCDMIANKMTGQKGVLFTAAYVTAFERMRNKLKENILTPPTNYLEALKALVASEERNLKLLTTTAQQEQIIGELRPKADYTDIVLKCKSLVGITQIAKDYGMSGTAMNKLLHRMGVQYKQLGQWLLYREHQDKGYTSSIAVPFKHTNGAGGVNMTTRWTQKGRLFIYNLLKEHGILPLIEKGDNRTA